MNGEIGIIDYGAGNLRSVALAMEKIGITPVVCNEPEQLAQMDRVIFPGVGAAGAAMDNLRGSGFDQAIVDFVVKGKPFLGICLGMQLLFDHSEEDGGVDCLGVIAGNVRKFDLPPAYKVPHMGWNRVLEDKSKCKMQNANFQDKASLKSIRSVKEKSEVRSQESGEQWFYFVHSYFCDPEDKAIVAGWTEHGIEFASAVQRGNVLAVQFHPEKSGLGGMRMLEEWVAGNTAK